MAVNIELLQKTLDTIKANPQHWNQGQWHCGTTHCFAGFAELIDHGLPIDSHSGDLSNDERFYGENSTDWRTGDNAITLLGITKEDADELFAASNTLKDLEEMVAALAERGTLQEEDGDETENEF